MATCAAHFPTGTLRIDRSRNRVSGYRMPGRSGSDFMVAADAQDIDRFFQREHVVGSMRIVTRNTSGAEDNPVNVFLTLAAGIEHHSDHITVAGDTEPQ